MAVRDGSGQFQVLTGNEIGCILLYHILSARVARGDLPKNALVVKSIVSTHLADAICAHFGVEIQDVLTGFRFISEKIHESSKTGTHTFLFGFEESFGFLSGEYSRDKDAISSAMLAAEACVSYRERGMTLYDGLQEIYRLFGFYHEKVQSYTLDGKEGMEKIASTMSALREAPICTIGKVPISWVEDYQAGILVGFDQTKLLTLPKTNMLRFLLQNDAWICIRPSGTEPKLKLYIGAKASDEAGVNHSLHTLYTDMDARLRELLDIR